jgi:ribosomal protein S4
MSIKRYTPKYKKLIKFHPPIWLEKSGKIKKFNRQKWEFKKRSYFPRKYIFFNQDVAASPVGKDFNDNKFMRRIKKTYKFLLRDKQRLQIYYGSGRFHHFKLKKLARKALILGCNRKISPSKTFLKLLESRIQNKLYRLGFVSSLFQARKFVNCGHLMINDDTIINTNCQLKKFDFVKIDPIMVYSLSGRYFRLNFPLVFFRFKTRFQKLLLKKKYIFLNSFIQNNIISSLSLSKTSLFNLKNLMLIENKLSDVLKKKKVLKELDNRKKLWKELDENQSSFLVKKRVLKKLDNKKKLLEKEFIKKLNINSILSQISSFSLLDNTIKNELLLSNSLHIKSDLYALSKLLKFYKGFLFKNGNLQSSTSLISFNLQLSKFYSSSVELNKKRGANALNLHSLIHRTSLQKIKQKRLENISNSDLGSILLGYNVYNKNFKYFNSNKIASLFNTLKSETFLKKIYYGRRFLLSKKRKAYTYEIFSKKKKRKEKRKKIIMKIRYFLKFKSLNLYNVKKKIKNSYSFKKNTMKIHYFLNLYKLRRFKYSNVKERYYNWYKKLIWRRKKRRKWRKLRFFRIFRSRHRVLYKFYVPRDIELNYKTFSFMPCQSLDLTTLNAKIPFQLNLRRLLTFVSL